MSEGAPVRVFRAPRTAAEVSTRLSEIYGQDPAWVTGVIHPCAAARADDGLLHVLRIGSNAPKSACDFFLLQAVRARADVVLTSSANLRAEPDLVHDFVGDSAQALADYRHQVARKSAPLLVFILTQSGELPRDHPVWSDASIKHVLVPAEGRARAEANTPVGTTIHVVDDLSLRSAAELARGLGHRTLSIEAGPTLSRGAYGPPSIVDELCLSICLQALAPRALGGALPSDGVLLAGRTLSAPLCEVEGWSFARYL